jgi:hypothetical protein
MYRNEVVGMVLVDSVHPVEWENPTPEQLRSFVSRFSKQYCRATALVGDVLLSS